LRKTLSEGRIKGIGFGFARKISPSEFQLTMPISACKDYLNDVVCSEHTGRELVNYGLNTVKLGIFTGGRAYLGMQCLRHRDAEGKADPLIDDLAVRLASGLTKIEVGIRLLEEALKIDGRTSFLTSTEGRYVADIPDFWVRYPYLISLWGLVVRNLVFWNGDPKSLMGFTFFASEDTYYTKAAKDKVALLVKLRNEGKDVPHVAMEAPFAPHWQGIISQPL